MSYDSLTGKRKRFVDAHIGKANCCKPVAARIAGNATPGQALSTFTDPRPEDTWEGGEPRRFGAGREW